MPIESASVENNKLWYIFNKYFSRYSVPQHLPIFNATFDEKVI